MYRNFLFSALIAIISNSESIAKDSEYYIALNGGFALPSDYLIADTFGKGHYLEGEIGLNKIKYAVSAVLSWSKYFDNSTFYFWDRSKQNTLDIYNINVRVRSDFIPDKTNLNIFVITGAGIYMADWLEKGTEILGGDPVSRKYNADFYGWNLEFIFGFEIPIRRNLKIRSTLSNSYIPANFRRYSQVIITEELRTTEYNSSQDYKSANLGGRRLGIGAVYYFNL